MTMPKPTPSPSRQHPLMIAAAIAVILFCAVGTAAILGWLPSSRGVNRAPVGAAVDPNAIAAFAPPADQATATVLPAQPAQSARSVSGTPLPGQATTGVAVPVAAAAGTSNAAAIGAYGYGGNQGSTAAPEPAGRNTDTGRTARADDVDTGARWCGTCGNIESIHAVTTRARGSGVGAGAGAILGGLLGNQIGHGNGRSLATVAGAVGGAVMGNQVEGTMHADHSYEIRVRLDDGTLRTFHQHSAPQWRTGDRVRIVKGSLRTA